MEVNGHEYSFTSIKSTLGTFKPKKLKSISYSDGLEPGEVEADTAQLAGATKGSYRAEASLEFATRRAYQEWIDSIGDGYMEKYFSITLTYSETNVSPVITDKIINCRIKKPAVDASGTDAVGVKVDLFVLTGIIWNGKKPIFDMQGV